MAKAATKATSRPPSTRTRIIERSILLFNRYSVQEVSIEQIASDLNMSRGNLNYHFRLKRDLILATLDVLEERLRVALERPVAVTTPKEAADYIKRIIDTFWEFRFFFNGLTYLLRNYPALRKRYFELRDWVLQTIETDIRYLATRGYFQPEIPPNSYRLLVENIWGLFLNWLRMAQIESPFAPRPEKKALQDCITHFWSLCHLWLEPVFARRLFEAFELDPKSPGSARRIASQRGNASTRRPEQAPRVSPKAARVPARSATSQSPRSTAPLRPKRNRKAS
jgi:AcrR family transcriptional regulator